MSDAVEALLHAIGQRGTQGDAAADLDAFGLSEAAGSLPPWALLERAQWLELVSGLAALNPAAAAMLATRYLAQCCDLPQDTGLVLWASGDESYWQIQRPCMALSYQRWAFMAQGALWAVPRSLWQPIGLETWECARAAAMALELPCGALTEALTEAHLIAQALLQGCMQGAWHATLQHATQRVMFGRTLADVPAIRSRLLQAYEGARAQPALFRAELEQVCGGSGYMVETRAAQSLDWLIWAEHLQPAPANHFSEVRTHFNEAE